MNSQWPHPPSQPGSDRRWATGCGLVAAAVARFALTHLLDLEPLPEATALTFLAGILGLRLMGTAR